jgi:hypothetical protein
VEFSRVHSALRPPIRLLCQPLDDYDDGEFGGMMIGLGNRSTRRKPAPVPLCPPQIPHTVPGPNPGRRGGKPATNRLIYGTARPADIGRGLAMDRSPSKESYQMLQLS